MIRAHRPGVRRQPPLLRYRGAGPRVRRPCRRRDVSQLMNGPRLSRADDQSQRVASPQVQQEAFRIRFCRLRHRRRRQKGSGGLERQT